MSILELATPAVRRPGRTHLQAAASALQQRLWLLIPLLAIPAVWPLYAEGLPRSYDGGLHLLRLAALDAHLRGGDLLPRWLPEMLLGYGYPLFNFYGAGSYTLAEALHLLGFSLYDAFVHSFTLVVLAAGFGAYRLGRDSFGGSTAWPALVVAVAYMYAPYVMDNVYIRGGLAEASALALLPWIFWSFRRLFAPGRPLPYALAAAATLAALAITHTITLLFTPPVLLGFLAVHWWMGGRRLRLLAWPAAAILLAMGLSAFFWLPLLLERANLATTAYTISRQAWLPRSVWTWENFLDRGFFFAHSFVRPNKLGLVQVIVAVAGFLLARRRDLEWFYFAAVTAMAAALIGAWALPLWTGSDILAVAQFPWRLLSVISLPLALFTGGTVVCFVQTWQKVLVACLLIALLIVAQRPQLAWIDVFSAAGTTLGPQTLAQIEVDKGVLGGGEGNSSIQEFRPRWADTTLQLEQTPAPSPLSATVLAANAYDLDLQVDAPGATSLRFQDFYYPGWQVTLRDESGRVTPLATYPSTNLGLLSVDLPAGTYWLEKRWQNTPAQVAGAAISLLALVAAALLCLRDRRTRLWALIPVALLGAALWALFLPRLLQPLVAPAAPVEDAGLRLLGYRTAVDSAGRAHLYPYWQVITPPPAGLRFRWQVQDAAGQVLAEHTTRGYYNTTGVENWPAGTLVDDAQLLPLPADAPAGSYTLAVALVTGEEDAAPRPVGTVELATPAPADPAPGHPLQATFDDGIRLAGFDYTLNGGAPVPAGEAPLAVEPGDYLWARLAWQATEPVEANYHGFVHMVDAQGIPVAQEDHIPGPLFHAPAAWQPGRRYRDDYLLRIPATAPGGLYWPAVGLYSFDDTERLAVRDAAGAAIGDHVRLRPIKVLAAPGAKPELPLSARFGDTAQMTGYTLIGADNGVRAGDTITLTLFLRSEQPTPANLTRFVHLYSPDQGMAAQADGIPQGGANPTWSWLPGEEIADTVPLQVAAEAQPGSYTLLAGFYDAGAGGARLPAFAGDGIPLPDQVVRLADVEVVE